MIYLKENNIPLNFAYEDEIVQEGNSTYQLSFKFPTNKPLWESLTEETLLLADDLHGEQEFIIFETETHHGYISVYANQVATLLNNYSISELNVDRVDGMSVMLSLAGSIIRDNTFSFTSNISQKHSINLKNTSVATALFRDKHSILGQWGGDLVRDKYDITLLSNGGVEKEALFMYKKNLKSYQHKKSTKDLRTRIHFTKTIDSQKEGEDDKVIRVTLDSPIINKYKNIYEGNLEVTDQDVVDEASLISYAKQYYKTTLCDLLEDAIEIDVIGKPDVPVRIFDTVTIFHEKFNLDVRKKITKYTFSPMGKKLKTIGFGKVQQSLGSALSDIVKDTLHEENSSLVNNIDERVKKELKSVDLAFTRKTENFRNDLHDEIEQHKAKSEVFANELHTDINNKVTTFKTEVNSTIKEFNSKLSSFDGGNLDELRKKIEETKKIAETTVKMVGTDDSITYNKNRLEGATEREIPLGTAYIELSHNGDGFEVGKEYTISWEAECRTHDFTDVKIVFSKPLPFRARVSLASKNNLYPRVDKVLEKGTKETELLHVYSSNYSNILISDWLKLVYNTVIITQQNILHMDISFKEVADGNSYHDLNESWVRDWQGEWNEQPQYILDGGAN